MLKCVELYLFFADAGGVLKTQVCGSWIAGIAD
jgi:hypothetical protein